MARKLPKSVLVALGVAALPLTEGCTGGVFGPCLKIAADTSEACTDSEDCDTAGAEVQGEAREAEAASEDEAAQRVLDRGVLPPDLADRLSKRR